MKLITWIIWGGLLWNYKYILHFLSLLFIMKISCDITCALCAITIFMKTAFDSYAAEPQQATNWIIVRHKFWKRTKGKTHYFHKIVRNDDVTPLTKSVKQHANELWSILALVSKFWLFKRIRRKYIPSGLIHAKETLFSTKRKVVNDNKTPGIKATISTWKIIKIQFNFALWFINWMANQAYRHKSFAGRFRLPPQPNGALQNNSILQPSYSSVRFLDGNCSISTERI